MFFNLLINKELITFSEVLSVNSYHSINAI
ncbi:hypothetical protein EMIT0196P_200062 [Pseudomonas chlororaphis]